MNIQTPQSFNYIALKDVFEKKSTVTQKTENSYISIYNDFATFDIETTSYHPVDDEFEPFAIMYLWQFYINQTPIFARTFEELVLFFDNISKALNLSVENRLAIYVHFLPFEFQFIRNFFEFESVFCTDKNQPCRAVTKSGLEFRCSYKLSNMSLSKFIESTPGATHFKLSGDEFDYSKKRTPITPLTQYELQYGLNDVVGLYEAVEYLLKSHGDTLATIPYTSTGYIRREARKAMKSNKSNIGKIKRSRLYPLTYTLLKNARRGGNAHCNPYYSCAILDNVKSKDMSSAYPAVMLQKKFPMSGFIRRTNDLSVLNDDLAAIIDITFNDIEIKTLKTIPYIPLAKCVEIHSPELDNGRIIAAKRLGIVLTDIDFKIIESQYNWSSIEINYIFTARYDYLPDEYRQYIFDRYKVKCELKSGDKYLYNKEKNKINALFGMMLTDIVNKEIVYQANDIEPYIITEPDLSNSLDAYYNSHSAFLAYQWGVWVTAHCRARLQQAIDGLGTDILYCDTDSAKYFGNHDDLFNKLNAQILDETEKCGFNTHYTSSNGATFDLGLWEDDGNYQQFVSMGSKKYGYIQDNKLSITVAGLSKAKGAEYMKKHGGLSCFKSGFTIPATDSGRTASYFNNQVGTHYITIHDSVLDKDVRVLTGSSIAVKNVSYTFGLSDDYETLLHQLDPVLD